MSYLNLDARSTDTAMHYAWTSHWEPPVKITASAWAEANLVLPPESNGEPGALRLRAFQRGMIDRTMRPDVRTSVFMLASQIGKSLSVDSVMAHCIGVDPGPMLHVGPTEQLALAFVRDRFDPLVRWSPTLRGLIGKGSKRGGDAKDHKKFPGGSLSFASSWRAESLASRSIRYLWLDEVDRFCESLGKEGDPVALARKRLHNFRPVSKCIISSSPTVEGSRIVQWFDKGDRARFFCPCPECGSLQTFRTEQLVWTPNRPQTAVLRCDDCGHGISDQERFAALEVGEWMPTAEPTEAGVISHHGSVLLGHRTEHASVAADMEEAESDDEKRRVFANTSDATPHRANEAERLDPEKLKARAETIRAPYSVEMNFVAASVDIQGSRAEVLFLGNASAGRQAILDRVVLPGDPTSAEFWNAIAGQLDRTFPIANGRTLPVAITAIDTGHESVRVGAFVIAQRRLGRRILAIKGVSDRLTRIPEARPEIVETGKLKGTNVAVWSIGVDTVKTRLAKRLNMPEMGPGFLALPDHMEDEFFQSLASEELQSTVLQSGYVRRQWVKKRKSKEGGGNEVWDLTVYSVAVSTLYKVPAQDEPPAPSITEFAAGLRATVNRNSGNN